MKVINKRKFAVHFLLFIISFFFITILIYSCNLGKIKNGFKDKQKKIVSHKTDSGKESNHNTVSTKDKSNEKNDTDKTKEKGNAIKEEKEEKDLDAGEKTMTIIPKDEYVKENIQGSETNSFDDSIAKQDENLLKIDGGDHETKIRPGLFFKDSVETMKNNSRKILFCKPKQNLLRPDVTMQSNLVLIKQAHLTLDLEREFPKNKKDEKTIIPKIKIIAFRMLNSKRKPILLKGKRSKEIKTELPLNLKIKILNKKNKNMESVKEACFDSDKTGACKIRKKKGSKQNTIIEFSIYCQPQIAKQYRDGLNNQNNMEDIKGIKTIQEIKIEKDSSSSLKGDFKEHAGLYGINFLKKYLMGGSVILEIQINGEKSTLYESKIISIDESYLFHLAPLKIYSQHINN